MNSLLVGFAYHSSVGVRLDHSMPMASGRLQGNRLADFPGGAIQKALRSRESRLAGSPSRNLPSGGLPAEPGLPKGAPRGNRSRGNTARSSGESRMALLGGLRCAGLPEPDLADGGHDPIVFLNASSSAASSLAGAERDELRSFFCLRGMAGWHVKGIAGLDDLFVVAEAVGAGTSTSYSPVRARH